jgi:exodeoxyribonuclease-3
MMKLYSWNVDGIRSVEKKGFFSRFINEHDPDILCLQETKAQPDQVQANFATLYPQYHQYWCSAEKKGYSGTALFTKQPPVEVRYNLPAHIADAYELTDEFGDTNCEGRVITGVYDQFCVVGVYTPNAKDSLGRLAARTAWDAAFLAYIKELATTHTVLFCGDLNVAHTERDLARPKANKGKKGFTEAERTGFQQFVDNSYVDTFRYWYPEKTEAYTWWSHYANARARNVGWRIDYVMAANSVTSHIDSAEIHAEVLGSDHCPVSLTLTHIS